MAPVLALLNQKGGVGKTSLTYHLIAAFAMLFDRWKILVVDTDPQASLSKVLMGPDAAGRLDPGATMAAVASGAGPGLEELEIPDVVPGLPGRVSLIPSSPALAEWNLANPSRLDEFAQCRLRDFLEPARSRFDLILIDCPPNLQLLSWLALMAATSLLIPTDAEEFGVQGLVPVLDVVEEVRAGDHPGLALAGIVVNRYVVRRAIHQLYEGQIAGGHGARLLATRIPEAAVFGEALAHRQPVGLYKPRSAAAKAVRSLAEELARSMIAVEVGVADGQA